MGITGDTTLITGASSGIGQAVARLLAKKSTLVIQGRNPQRLAAVHTACGGPPNVIWRRDFADATGTGQDLARFLQEEGLQVNNFVHCAGVAPVGPARLIDRNRLKDAMDVNVASALEIVSHLLKKSVNGSSLRAVVLASSIWGRYGASGHVLYSATKGAIDAAMRSLAVELAPAVRVNCIAFGAIETPMSARALANSDIRSRIDADYPLGLGTVEQAAGIVKFLLSEDASWITGQVMVVDGGRTSHMSNK